MKEKRVDTYTVTRSIGLEIPLGPPGRHVYSAGDVLVIGPADRAADKHGLLTRWLAHHVADGTLVWQSEASGPVTAARPIPPAVHRNYIARAGKIADAAVARVNARRAPARR